MSVDTGLSPHPRYRLLARIGKGGMGEVFRAQDRLTGQVVALKRVSLPLPSTSAAPPIEARRKTSLGEAATLTPEAMLTPEAPVIPGGPETVSSPELQALMQEPEPRSHTPELAATVARSSPVGVIPAAPAPLGIVPAQPAPSPGHQSLRLHLAQEFRTLAGLRHPHIVSVLDYGFDQSQQPYFTMQLLEGGQTLDEAARNQSVEVRVGLLLQILQALAYLHRRGVLHRDLKPGNILVISGPRGPQVKVLDFGLALGTQELRTRFAEIAGTIGYIAPEVLVGAQPSEASDLFAVGVIAHELLLGSHPLGGLPTAALIKESVGTSPIFVEDARLGTAMSAVLRRAMSRLPDERYADAMLFSRELAQAAGLPSPIESADIRESFLQAADFQARDTEMDLLLSALRQAMHGRGQVLLIGGESGVGKSRLFDEFRAQALVRGAHVLRGQAVREGGGAFLVLRDVLAPLCLEQPLDELQSGVLLPLIPRLPELLERTVVQAPDIDAKNAQDRALAVIEQVLLGAATAPIRPLVVLLEDLHWAGSEVLLLLERLSEMSQSRPLLVLGNYRDDERPELPDAIPHTEVLKLKRFSKESVTTMAIAMLGSTGQRGELVERLFQETEGNAFFIVETLRALAEDAGQLAAVGSRELPARILSGGVRAVLENRLGRVPASARPMLERAAVAGRRLDLRVLGNSGPTEARSTTAMEAWLAACADLSILEISDQVWRFSHDKLREYLLEQVERRGELSQLHRDVATAIERAYGEAERVAHSAALAFHFAKAGDARQAARYGLQAGERALNGGALEEAVTHLEATLRYQVQCSSDLLEGAFARRMLCTALFALGRMEQCTKVFRELYEYVGHPLPSHASRRAVVLARSIGSYAASRVFPSLRLTPALSRDVVREIELTIVRAGSTLSYTANNVDLLVVLLLSFVLANQAGNDDSKDIYEGVAEYLLSMLPLGRLNRRRPTELPSRRTSFMEAHSVRRLMVCAANAGQGHWGHVMSSASRGSEAAEAAGSLGVHMTFELIILFALLYSGDHDQARIKAEWLGAAAIRHKNTVVENWSLVRLASLDLIASQPHVALERLHARHATSVRTLDGVGLEARAYLMLGERSLARHQAEQALSDSQTLPLTTPACLEGFLAAAEVLSTLAGDEQDKAERRSLMQLAGRALIPAWHFAMTFPIGLPRAALVTGMYARMRGQTWLARIFFQRALSTARELSMPYEEERAQSALANLATQAN